MYDNLIKIIISSPEFGTNNLIIVDNENKCIFLNERYKKFSENEFIEFLDKFFRIIRHWNNEFNDLDSVTTIKIIEKNNIYDICVKNVPNNFDSFIDLINKQIYSIIM